MASLLHALLRMTNFKNPFLRTFVPAVGLIYGLQIGVAIPSIIAQSERFYDVSGSLTYLAATGLSLYLPAIRARAAAANAGLPIPPLPSLLAPFSNPSATLNWRQVILSAAVSVWATRLGSYLFERVLREGKDSRFDEIKKSPPRFLTAWIAQGTWVTLCTLPVLAINSVPSAALRAVPGSVRITDAIGLSLFLLGFGFEVVADRQKAKWASEKRAKLHDEQFMTRGLWTVSQYPNYFGEISLWTGIATVAAGALRTQPIQSAIGLGGGVGGMTAAAAMSYISPLFAYLLLTKVSGIPLSEKKYDKKFGDRKDYQEWKKNTPRLIPKLL
ncbi:hypothetical protein MCOR25_000402 [Pyricularia grisea]|nr:hypothetical protein MCOR25_000402 [Pyricularia grisea]